MDNKEKFKKIRMEDVYKAIVENGFYTTPTEKHYDENFIGPELIVVTDDPEFKTKHPDLSEMIIVSSVQFKPMADIYNESMWNDQREIRRYERWHNTEGKLREQNHVIERLRTKGFMDDGKYQEQTKELNNKIRKLQAELKKITRSDDEDDVLEQLDMLIDYFEKRDQIMVSFEPETFDMMVDKITANQNELTFHLLGGIELKEKM